jgi:hypothetical protein
MTRQEILVPLRMKIGGDEVWEIGLPEKVADSIYHP